MIVRGVYFSAATMAMHRNAIAWATMTDKDIMDVLPALHYSPHNGKGIDIKSIPMAQLLFARRDRMQTAVWEQHKADSKPQWDAARHTARKQARRTKTLMLLQQKIRMADDKRRLLAEQAKQHAQAVAQMQEDFWK